jgi:hypothetical protein
MISFIWVFIAAIIGFCIAAIFSGLLKLPRNIYLIIYIPLAFVLFAAFVLINKISILATLSHNLLWGLVAAVLAGVFVVKNVFSQPPSERTKGLALFIDVTWAGLLYGLTDAILLSVIPVFATNQAFANSTWANAWYGKITVGLIALISSFFVTTAYHLGYTEFRSKKVIWPNIGNGILSIVYILTLNPLSAILPHMGMHVAAMIHGRETTGQVPPHYPSDKNQGNVLK